MSSNATSGPERVDIRRAAVKPSVAAAGKTSLFCTPRPTSTRSGPQAASAQLAKFARCKRAAWSPKSRTLVGPSGNTAAEPRKRRSPAFGLPCRKLRSKVATLATHPLETGPTGPSGCVSTEPRFAASLPIRRGIGLSLDFSNSTFYSRSRPPHEPTVYSDRTSAATRGSLQISAFNVQPDTDQKSPLLGAVLCFSKAVSSAEPK